MKIPILAIGNNRIYLYIEKRYTASLPIIPIGCDCHPAYVLKSLHIRNISFPFDWLNTKPSTGIDYVNRNIKSEFSNFLDKLTRNKDGNIVSDWYRHTEFLHYDRLIDNKKLVLKLLQRAKRFMEFYNNKECIFFNRNALFYYSTDINFIEYT